VPDATGEKGGESNKVVSVFGVCVCVYIYLYQSVSEREREREREREAGQ